MELEQIQSILDFCCVIALSLRKIYFDEEIDDNEQEYGSDNFVDDASQIHPHFFEEKAEQYVYCGIEDVAEYRCDDEFPSVETREAADITHCSAKAGEEKTAEEYKREFRFGKTKPDAQFIFFKFLIAVEKSVN